MTYQLPVTGPSTNGSRSRAVHQFHPGAAYGDAITSGMLLTRRLLRELGFESDIFVVNADERLGDEVRLWNEYPSAPDNVLFVHHSLGHATLDEVLRVPDQKVLVYHNITPTEFFPDDPYLREHSELGRRQLPDFRGAVVGSICDSQFNADELSALGFRDVAVVPLLIDAQRPPREPWNARIVDENAGVFTMLFVGRIERNKCQHDVIEVFRLVDRWLDRPVQCVFAGTYNPYVSYVGELQRRAASYGLSQRTRFLNHVTQEDLYGWYRAADVFVCMSEHEGFGVPLVEAMSFGVPVIAHASSNVPHTLGGAGILVEGKPIEEIAASMWRSAGSAKASHRASWPRTTRRRSA